MKIRQLEYFLAVTSRGTFSGAATELGVTQSALSQGISALEEAVGAPLFDRSPQGVRLTGAGREFEGPARDAVEATLRGLEAVTRVDRLGGGSLVVACPPTLAVDPLATLLSAFHREFPDVRLRVVDLPEREVDEQRLLDLGADLAVTFAEHVAGDLQATELDPLELVALLPRPARSPVIVHEVLRRGLVVPAQQSAPRLYLASRVDAETIEESVAVEVAHPEAVLQLVLSGAGATIVGAGQAVSAASMPGLAVCELEPKATLPLVAAVPVAALSAATSQFLRICRESRSAA